MKERYEEVSENINVLLKEIKSSFFPELRNAHIKVLFDLKKRKSGGKIVIAKIVKPNELLRHFTIDEAYGGYDYILILDKVCWNACDDKDKIRIIRHELRHTYFDIESENNPYKLVKHDMEDFYAEVELNKDDPRWGERLAQLTSDIYEQQKENKKTHNK